MFNFSGSEIIFLLVLGLVILGPEKLPGVLRRAGRLYGEFKRMTSDAQSEMRRAFAEPIRDIQQTVSSYKMEFDEGARSIVDDLRSDPATPPPSPPPADPASSGGTGEEMTPRADPDQGRAP